jgi:hypothetical protein
MPYEKINNKSTREKSGGVTARKRIKKQKVILAATIKKIKGGLERSPDSGGRGGGRIIM